MVPLSDDIYCSQQIRVPPALPDLLKAYTKAAIRTRPRDLLRWSAAYFGALATGQDPPALQRLEPSSSLTAKGNNSLLEQLPTVLTATMCKATPELLRALHRQFSVDAVVSADAVREAWSSLGQPTIGVEQLLLTGGFEHDQVPWLHLLALAAGTVCSSLTDTVQLICNIIAADAASRSRASRETGATLTAPTQSDEPGALPITYDIFERVYRYLVSVDGTVPESRVEFLLSYLSKQATQNNGLVYPYHLQQADCPGLQFP